MSAYVWDFVNYFNFLGRQKENSCRWIFAFKELIGVTEQNEQSQGFPLKPVFYFFWI